jgi:hypothetical protein
MQVSVNDRRRGVRPRRAGPRGCGGQRGGLKKLAS